MSKIITEIHVCDRCGKEHKEEPLLQGFDLVTVYHQPSMLLRFKSKHYDIYGWRYERNLELCKECMDAMEEWLSPINQQTKEA